jgi:predicted membrane-bound mannosyltransferase
MAIFPNSMLSRLGFRGLGSSYEIEDMREAQDQANWEAAEAAKAQAAADARAIAAAQAAAAKAAADAQAAAQQAAYAQSQLTGNYSVEDLREANYAQEVAVRLEQKAAVVQAATQTTIAQVTGTWVNPTELPKLRELVLQIDKTVNGMAQQLQKLADTANANKAATEEFYDSVAKFSRQVYGQFAYYKSVFDNFGGNLAALSSAARVQGPARIVQTQEDA